MDEKEWLAEHFEEHRAHLHDTDLPTRIKGSESLIRSADQRL